MESLREMYESHRIPEVRVRSQGNISKGSIGREVRERKLHSYTTLLQPVSLPASS